MRARAVAAAIAMLYGGWVLFDGLHAVKIGRYFGAHGPGPWSDLVASLGIDPVTLAPFFVAAGIAWFTGAGAILSRRYWAWGLTVFMAVIMLWYLVAGTVISAVYLVVAVLFRKDLC